MLEIIIFLGAIMNFSAVGYMLMFITRPEFALKHALETMIPSLTLTFILVAVLFPDYVFIFKSPSHYLFYVLAPLVGLLVILTEYTLNQLVFYIRYKTWTFRTSIHTSFASLRASPRLLLLLLWGVVLEELLIRQSVYYFLTEESNWIPGLALVMTALVYSTNHLNLGLQQIINKFASGLIYALLFYSSDLSIGVVIVAHATQNVALLIAAPILLKNTDMRAAAKEGIQQ